MSRIAKQPIELPKGVEFKQSGQTVTVTAGKAAMSLDLHPDVELVQTDNVLQLSNRVKSKSAIALAGTMRALIANMVVGVTDGFQRKLELRGVGYRAKSQGKMLNLTLGFSHPVNYDIPDGITVDTPSQTEVVVKGVDKQKVGQVAAEIRAFRPPEPYKGKGVRYADEHVVIKEAKKK